jgi:beta-glucosidase
MTPLYPFGFGLSYTSFDLGDLTVDESRFEADGAVNVSVMVTNTGARAGSTVVQLYIGDTQSSSPRPAKELKAFTKIALAAGESKKVILPLDARSFAFFRTEAKHWLVEAGDFTLHVGQSSADLPLSAKLTRNTTLMLPV